MFKLIDGKVRFEYDESKVFIDLDDVKSQKIKRWWLYFYKFTWCWVYIHPTVSDGYASKVIAGVGLSYEPNRTS